MVCLERLDEHIFEGHPQCISKTCDTHSNPIWFRGVLLPSLFLAGIRLSISKEACCGTSPSYTVSHTGSNYTHTSSGGVPNRRTSSVFNSNIKDSSLSGPYNQGSFTPLHRVCIPNYIRYSLPSSHLHLPDSPHTRRNARLLRRIQRQPLRNPLRLPRSHYLRHPKHLLQTAVQRSSRSRSIRNSVPKT